MEGVTILALTPDTPARLERLGGKGCGLVRLLAAGFRVPEAWCIPADARTGDDADLDRALEAFAAEHPDTEFAVRSSATAEDLADASFAGVYATTLGVRGHEELKRAVRCCLDSLRSDAARAYRRERGLGEDVRMAVLIQRLIEPDVAGVMLTANPQRAFADEIVIDAAPGLGEGVVSGRADPDHFVLERSTGRLREERIGEKRVALRRGRGGVLREEPVPEAERARACLAEEGRAALFELARQIESTLGSRMDVEWARVGDELHLLQARPITGLPPLQPSEVHSRRFGDEYMADYTTPAGFTYLVRWIREYSFTDTARQLGRADLLALDPLLRHRGRVYLSARYVALSLRALPPGMREGGLRDWFPPMLRERFLAEPFEPRLLLATCLMPLRDPRGRMARNVAALEKHATRVMQRLGARLDEDLAALDDAELALALSEVDEIGYDHFRVIRWGMGQYAPLFHSALQGALASWVDDDGELYQALVAGLPGTHTAEINRDIWRLGQLARRDGALHRALRDTGGSTALRATHPGEFWEQLDEFLARHGHRSTTRDVAEPRWRERPDLVLSLVRAQLVGDASPQNPEQLEAASMARRVEAEARVRQGLGRGIRASLRRVLLRFLLRHAQTFTVYRENQRYYLDVILCRLRNLLLEHGRRLTRRGVLDDPWQAFLLQSDELVSLFAPDADAGRGLASDLPVALAERRAHYERWKTRLPATFLFDGIETEGEIVEGDPPDDGSAASAGEGLGASRGVVRARLRVLASVEDLHRIESGEILVAENIDPGWTSVFPMLAGLVTETGGVLSHGALLAREYGIPAVMGVRAATDRFTSGTWVVLDGTRGTIEMLSDIEANAQA